MRSTQFLPLACIFLALASAYAESGKIEFRVTDKATGKPVPACPRSL